MRRPRDATNSTRAGTRWTRSCAFTNHSSTAGACTARATRRTACSSAVSPSASAGRRRGPGRLRPVRQPAGHDRRAAHEPPARRLTRAHGRAHHVHGPVRSHAMAGHGLQTRRRRTPLDHRRPGDIPTNHHPSTMTCHEVFRARQSHATGAEDESVPSKHISSVGRQPRTYRIRHRCSRYRKRYHL